MEMSMLYFVTPGLIDLEAVFTFGVHAKETDNPIGYFGTGLKFSIATLLRTGHKVHIHRGNTGHEFRVVEMTFRDKQFQKIFLDGRDLAFTTDLGRNWEIWMAFRELESNTRDENGFTTDDGADLTRKLKDQSEFTTIVVSGDGIMSAYQDRQTTFCSSHVIASTPDLEVREGRSSILYYRGVRVGTTGKPGLYTYNILSPIKLSEDRQVVGLHLPWHIGKALASFTNDELLKTILTAPDGTFEHDLDFNPSQPSPEFLEAFKTVSNTGRVNQTARKLFLTRCQYEEATLSLNTIQAQQLERAIAFLEELGFPISQFPVKCTELHGHLGEARNGVIFLSTSVFRMGTKFVASTILEEYIHLKEGVFDETREMQNILFDTIISMGEKMRGLPI
jgi:hypothetical protein